MTPERFSRSDVERLELAEVAFSRWMFVVAPPHRPRAAAADTLFGRSECRLLAAQTEREIHRTRLRAVGHRAPALEAGRARAPVDLHAELRDLAWPIRPFPRLRIDVDERLVADVGGADECAGLTIELPQDPELAHLEERLAAADVDEHVLEHFVHVVRLAREMLIEPLHLSGVGIERERRVRVERRAVGAADGPCPRLGLCRAPVAEIRCRIVTAGDPRIAAGTEREWQVAPCVATRLTRPRDRRRPPQFLTGLCVVPGDEADVVFVA